MRKQDILKSGLLFVFWAFSFVLCPAQTVSETPPSPSLPTAPVPVQTIVPPATPAPVPPTPLPTSPVSPQIVAVQSVPVTPLTDQEKDALEEQKEFVSRLPNPNDLIDYFQNKVLYRQYEKAYACIDFGTMALSQRSKRNIVYMLNIVLSRLDTKDVYDYPTDEPVMVQSFHSPHGPIELEFVRGEHQNWRFAPRTIRDLEQYFTLLRNDLPIRHHWVMKYFPEWSIRSVFGVPIYRIATVVLILLLSFVFQFLSQLGLFYLCRTLFDFLMGDWDRRKMTRQTWQPIGLAVLVSFWYLALMVMYPTPEILDFFYFLHTIFFVAMGIWMLFRVVDLFSLWLRQKLNNRDPNIDVIFLPLFTRTTKILIVALGCVSLAQAFQWPIVGIVSGMGIGGVAIAFAAKETIANFFGSVTVLADRPFVIGDWIVTGEIEGTVEAVGMRSTRIRTFYNSLVTIPNNFLTTAVIDNMGARRFRRYRTFLNLPYGTEPDRIEAFCEGIRELIRRHPYTRKDLFYVYLNEFKPAYLEVLLIVHFVCPDSAIEYRERGRLISDILRLAHELGVEFAFPTQTIYNPPPLSAEKASLSEDPINWGRNAAGKIFPVEE